MSSKASEALRDDVDLKTLPDDTLSAPRKQTTKTVNPNPLSFFTLEWLTPLIWQGTKRQLFEEDLYLLRKPMYAEYIEEKVVDRYNRDFRQWLQDGASSRPPSLLWAMIRPYLSKWLISAALYGCGVACGMALPIFVQQAVLFFSNEAPPVASWSTPSFTINSAVALAFILFAFQAFRSIFIQSSASFQRELQMNMQSAIIIGAHQKAFRLDQQGAVDHTAGNIMNIINVDSERVGLAVEYTQQFWGYTAQLGVSIALVYSYIGNAIWAGIGSVVFVIFIQMAIVPLTYNFTGTEMEVVDKRLGFLREMFQGIKLIKLRVLESHMISSINEIRNKQLKFIKFENYLAIALFSSSQSSSILLPVFSFLVFAADKGRLDAALVFPALSLFALLIEPLNFLPQIVSSFIQARVSWDRICRLLQAPELLDPTPPSRIESSSEPKSFPTTSTPVVSLSDVSFRWPKSASTDTEAEEGDTLNFMAILFKKHKKGNEIEPEASPDLHCINLDLPPGSFSVIVGPAGSGKSSLLSAMSGQLIKTAGEFACTGRIAYVTQKPWFQTQTIEDNILFGSGMDPASFSAVVKATALAPDFALLPNGAKSQVAEGAANLSGGQQARVALARALYSQADIYLLDDTFSALDPHVADQVFTGTMDFLRSRGKTVLLVTHDLRLAEMADMVYVMSAGRIVEHGKKSEITASSSDSQSKLLGDWEEKRSGPAEGHPATKTGEIEEEAVEGSEEEEEEDELIITEGRKKGQVSWTTYLRYIQASGGFTTVAYLLSLLFLQQASVVLNNLWLYWWTAESFPLTNRENMLTYSILGVAVCFFYVLGNMSVVMATFKACAIYHRLAVENVAHASLHFFETNPVGRIMNRFSKDMNAMDHELYIWVFNVVTGIFIIIGLVIVMCWPSGYLAIMIPVVGGIYYLIYIFYRGANIELKRLTSKNRSPLFSHVSETLEGAYTIRSFERVDTSLQKSHTLLDFSNQPFYISRSAELWLLLRIEILASVVTLAMVLISRAMNAPGALVGLALSSCLALTNEVNALIRSTAEMESHMNATERLDEYAYEMVVEGDGRGRGGMQDVGMIGEEVGWSSGKGEIRIENLVVRYPTRPNVMALREINLNIAAGEKIGVVGRTGSGKSTLLTALMRLVEFEGLIRVDGIDISNIPLSTLRTRLVCVPQESTLFSGTLRSNLDPSNIHSDAEICSALSDVGFTTKDLSEGASIDLTMPLTAGGKPLSQGQRQLVVLATALLRLKECSTSGVGGILLLDEATASLDGTASNAVTSLLRGEDRLSDHGLQDVTTITIAHRLETVVRMGKIVVLDSGAVHEVGTPKELLERGGVFRDMVAALGRVEEARIRALVYE